MFNTSAEQATKDQLRQFFENFLNTFEEIHRVGNQQVPVKVYHKQVEDIIKNTSTTFYVNFKHLMNLGCIEVIQIIYNEYYKYEPTLKQAASSFIYSLFPDYAKGKNFALSFFNLHEVEEI
jgi:DNA replicative helicase MCM subunit Mcm2 (Cdc46/Mcm family)